MKSIRDFIAQDMWSHILMTGPDIRGYLSGERYPSPKDKEKYCQGILTVYPHMMLANFSTWLWDGNPPKGYSTFMDSSVKALQSKVFPTLAQCFDLEESISEAERGDKLIPLLTDVIPKHVLTGFYDYMFSGEPNYQDISEYWIGVQPLLDMAARNLKWAYSQEGLSNPAQRQEVFLFIGTRMAGYILKRWYDWQYGEDKLETPPGPPPDGDA